MKRTVDHLLYYMPRLARKAESPWERKFASDMARRAKWRNWTPSEKQQEIMQGMVSSLFDEEPNDLIEIEKAGSSAA